MSISVRFGSVDRKTAVHVIVTFHTLNINMRQITKRQLATIYVVADSRQASDTSNVSIGFRLPAGRSTGKRQKTLLATKKRLKISLNSINMPLIMHIQLTNQPSANRHSDMEALVYAWISFKNSKREFRLR